MPYSDLQSEQNLKRFETSMTNWMQHIMLSLSFSSLSATLHILSGNIFRCGTTLSNDHLHRIYKRGSFFVAFGESPRTWSVIWVAGLEGLRIGLAIPNSWNTVFNKFFLYIQWTSDMKWFPSLWFGAVSQWSTDWSACRAGKQDLITSGH